MGGLVQQVNLYRGRAASNASSAGARLLLFSAVGALLAVVLLAVAGEFYLSALQSQRVQAAAALQQQESELAALKEQLNDAKPDPFLEAELARLGEARTRLNMNLTTIVQQRAAAPQGFSAVFASLARNTLDGLWFNNVGLSAGGSEMQLKGQAVEPALVPRLLQSLANEQAFAGRTFRKVRFERQEREAGAIVDFELRSAQTEEVGDAG